MFGAPVEKDGVTIVPVARVRYGVGGGGGRGAGRKKKRDAAAPDEVGYGHGGGVQASPVGYIELRDGQASYKRIVDPVRPMVVLLLFPLVGVVSCAAMAVITVQVAKSLRKMMPTLPHVPFVHWRQSAAQRRWTQEGGAAPFGPALSLVLRPRAARPRSTAAARNPRFRSGCTPSRRTPRCRVPSAPRRPARGSSRTR